MSIFNLFSKKNKELIIKNKPLDKITCIRYTMTWKCNFKCTSCNIWNNKNLPHNDINVDEIDDFTQAHLLKNVKEVILSGGEPLLREDFEDIILAMHRNLKHAKFSITTNGFDPDHIYGKFKNLKEKAPDLIWGMIGISLNGPKEIHDASRGVPGSFENAVKTAEMLKEFSNRVDFSFTFLRNNVEYFDWVNDLAKKKNLKVHICWTVMNDRFSTNYEDLIFDKDISLISILERYTKIDEISYHRSLKETFLRNRGRIRKAYLYDSIINKRIMPCNAGRTFFHLAPNGDIYPCNFKLSSDRVLGNIREKSFKKIWDKIPERIFKEIKNGECMYPNGLCGDSDIFRSINQSDSVVYEWFSNKINNKEKMIDKKV